ncbi:MAG: hypothetical protein GY946_01770 [bacterium]|nr:hypothetical protein [bacterium]
MLLADINLSVEAAGVLATVICSAFGALVAWVKASHKSHLKDLKDVAVESTTVIKANTEQARRTETQHKETLKQHERLIRVIEPWEKG